MNYGHSEITKRVPDREFPFCPLGVDPLEKRVVQIGRIAKSDDFLPGDKRPK